MKEELAAAQEKMENDQTDENIGNIPHCLTALHFAAAFILKRNTRRR